MRVMSVSSAACVATLMVLTVTPAASQPSAVAFERGNAGRVQTVEHRTGRHGYGPRHHGRYYGRYHRPYYAPYAYYGPYYGPYYYPYYYRPYYGPSVSFSFGF
jgi:hypothetical protein